MISFSLSSDQKRAILENSLVNIQTRIYTLILNLGGDPDSYDFSQIDEMSSIPAPSDQNSLYTAYQQYLAIQTKISNL